jgi:hypothetical protein
MLKFKFRLAEVWMDEYKRIFYLVRPDLIGRDCGDLSSRKEIKKRLNCRSFKWFLDEIFPEKFVPGMYKIINDNKIIQKSHLFKER